jgi:hypothetical protein
MPARLLSMPASATNLLGFLATSLAIAWTLVWLLGDRVARGNRLASFVLSLVLMLMTGVWAHMGDYGFVLDPRALQSAIGSGICFGACALTLLLAMGLARLSCRKQYRPGRFMAWLALWMFVVPAALMLPFAVLMMVAIAAFDPDGMLMVPVMMGTASGFLAVTLYLLNLPFMILAFKSPFYRERLQTVFGLRPVTEEAPGVCPFRAGPAGEPDDVEVQSI